ncbi:MAG: potassium channel family protein [Candidatus Nomurabacteria bacterium]|nr:potassium channel family protein [Candidatus Nomurabacteria bacterium]
MTSFYLIFIRFGRAIKSAWQEPEFRALVFIVFVILLAGTIVYHALEGWSYLDSLFFSVTTLTTVGYGGNDLIPHSTASKIFTMVYIFLGLGIILSFINTIARHAQKEPSVTHALVKEGKEILEKLNIIQSDLEKEKKN